MSFPRPPRLSPEAARFRARLLAVLAVMVGATALGVFAVSRSQIAGEAERQFEREFQSSLALLHSVQQTRHALLVERCRTLARKPRIVAALEDGAVDLLYLSAHDELRDLLTAPTGTGSIMRPTAQFYRFLDVHGKVIAPDSTMRAGAIDAATAQRLSLASLPLEPQTGYLPGPAESSQVREVFALPIVALETGEAIAALVLGFASDGPVLPPLAPQFLNGLWVEGRLYPTAPDRAIPAELAEALAPRLAKGPGLTRFRLTAGGSDWLVFRQRFNAGTLFAPAEEICLFPLAAMQQRQRDVAWQIAGVGAVILLAGLVSSYVLSFRLSEPVEQLAHDSREQRAGRQRAEAALESTSAELARAARFSANASHQLKTPVAVLRAGLEVLLSKQRHGAMIEAEEFAALIHQTYRVSSVIEDLLLLSRMDAGQLQLKFGQVNLGELVAAALDDLSALPEENNLTVESECPADLKIAGEKRYTALIMQNLLENARKYNRPNGRIRIAAAETADGTVTLTVGNTAMRAIPDEVREHIFERFHRGGLGENIPGYGLGLNLARELARIHRGDLQLLRSDAEWTEFAVTFRTAPPAGSSTPPIP